MSWFAYIRKGMVYIPSSAITTDGILVEIEPIETASVRDTSALRQAVVRVINRGRKLIPPPPLIAYENAPILALAGVKTWSGFYKGTVQIGFFCGESGFEIYGLKRYERGFTADESTRIKLGKDLPVELAIDRIVDEIQHAGT